ncbi:MAG: MATE family efflux transporter [Rhizobiales bacterium]|nr:MATE family efflux transporter [Hyphomicrobiales bacterium]
MTLAYLSTPLLGFVDTTVIGRLGSAQLLGGIAIGAILFDFLFTVFNFLRMGTTGLTAQAIGAGERSEASAILWRTMIVAIAAGVAIIVFREPILAGGLAFMGGSAEVNRATTVYFDIRVLSAPLALANYAILGWFLGFGRAGIGLILQTLLNGTNIVLSVWFVLGLGWSIEGVAWATVIGELVGLLAGLGLIAIFYGRNAFAPVDRILNRDKFVRLFSLNRDIMIRSTALLFVFAFFTSEGARQGDLILAANAVLLNFFLVAGYFLDGFAVAAEQLVGTAIGARSRAMAQRAISLTVLWGVALGAFAAAFLFAAGPMIIDFVTTAPLVREAARAYLPWAAATPLIGALAFEFDGVYIGATWSVEMRNWMLASVAVAAIVWWIALPLMANHGLWLALLMFLGARGVTLALRCPVNLNRIFGVDSTA